MKLNPYDVKRCRRFLPKVIKDVMKHNKVFVGGGFITSIVTGNPINDIDLFVPSKELAETLVYSLKTEVDKTHKSDNAITIIRDGKPAIQIIHRWVFDNLEDMAKSFDFTISCAGLSVNDSYCDDNFYQDLSAKRLIYRHPIRNEDAGGSMLRLLKYYRKGYTAPLNSIAGVVTRMVKDIDFGKVDPKDEDRLTKVITGLLIEVDPNAVVID